MTIAEKLDKLYGKSEARLNAELAKLRDEMEKSRCSNCGFTGFVHQDWCQKKGGR